jgi:hypothetical protein
VVAIAWFAARPLLAGALIAAGVAAFFGAKVLADRRAAARGPARPPGIPGAAYAQHPPPGFPPPGQGR